MTGAAIGFFIGAAMGAFAMYMFLKRKYKLDN